MATFSDGGNVAAMADHDAAGNMGLYLQGLLDNKEKQLQSAATLGHQLLAQRVELEERIRQMQELELDGSGSDDGLDVSVRDKYRELADAITAWDTENEQLTSVFGSKVSGDLIALRSLIPNSRSYLISPRTAYMLLPPVTWSLRGTNTNGPRVPLLVRRLRSRLVARRTQLIEQMMLVSPSVSFDYRP